MAKPAKSLLERKKELIDAQDHLSEKEKKKAKEEVEKTEKIKASKKEETRRILEEEQKEFEKAAERSAAGEERYRAPRDSARQKISDSNAKKAGVSEDVFEKIEKDYYESRKKEEEEEEKRWENFGKEFEKVLEESSDYVTEKQAQGKIAVPEKGYGSRNEWYQKTDDDFLKRYEAAEDYVMSEGENAFENTVKGMFNNTRSTLGKTAERAEFFLSDNIPGYRAGKNVYTNNDPGYISDVAKKQFGNAKETTGAFEDRVIDAADIFSKELGYGIFGLKSADWFRNADIGFTEYENLRRSGVSKEEALFESAKKAGFSFAEDKLWDMGGELLNGKTSYNVSGITSGTDKFVDNFDLGNYNRANKPGELINEF